MTKPDLAFSLAGPQDAPRIRDLLHAAFRAPDTRPDWTADMEMNRRFTVKADDLAARLSDPDTVFLVATDAADATEEGHEQKKQQQQQQKDLLACIGVAKVTVTKGRPTPVPAARLFQLAIDPRLHRNGLGAHVLHEAETYARVVLGVRLLSLDALSTRTELIAWYLRRGYRRTGEVVPFPVREIDGLILPEDLGFVEMEKDIGSGR